VFRNGSERAAILGALLPDGESHHSRVFALLGLAALGFLLSGCGGALGPATVTVRIDRARVVRTVPRSFLGISTEWDSVGAYAGRGDGLRRLLAPLVARTGGLALRIGGDTADQAWWDPHGRPAPPAVLQDITPATLAAVGRLARTLRGPVTLDVNLPLADPGNARALVRAAARGLPAGALDTVEIGNEPDLYTRGRVFRVPGHVHLRLRKRVRYGPALYRRDVLPYLSVLSRPPQPARHLAIGGFATRTWWPSLAATIGAAHGKVGALSAHLYALPRCGGSAPPVSWLLTSAASRDRAATLAPLIAIARRQRLPVRVTELNSAACGGRRGLSDSFASALWLTDTLFALLRDGVAQADVHTWAHARYSVFTVAGTRAAARPLLTGMTAFARAAPPGSRLLSTHVRADALRAWATVDRRGAERVALLAPDEVIARVAARRCATAWVAGPRGMRTARVCPRRGRLAIGLQARTMAVLTIAPAS